MKARYILCAAAALLSQAFAGTPVLVAPALEPVHPATVSATKSVTKTDCLKSAPLISCKRLSGSITAGAATNYVSRGVVASHALAEGDGVEKASMNLSYDIGRKGFFTIENQTSYTVLSSGHHLMGDKGTNLENELSIATSLKYTRNLWFTSVGYQFTHGGLLGAQTKHIKGEGASVLNEGFATIGMTPISWLEFGVKASYSFDGLKGWWFEPYIKGTFTMIGTCEKPTLQGVVTMGMSATTGYFSNGVAEQHNGVQAWWIEGSLPYYITEHLVLTPSVSVHWLGCGALNHGVPADRAHMLRNHAVVAGLSLSYIF